MTIHDMLAAGLALLLVAVLVVPLAARLKMGAILGYLVVGIMVGPWGLGIIRDVDEILHFSELGVALLLFVIGLELNPKKLWSLRQAIFGIGTAQVLLSAVLLVAILFQYGFAWPAALIGGLGLAMSSTAIALQLVREKSLQYNESGQLAFAVLLFQDMAVIPILALIPLLGGGNLVTDWQVVGLKGLAFFGILLGGRYLLRPILRYIAASKVREVFTAATLLVVLGIAFLMDMLGFSMALGTFIAGVLLADSEYRHELESTIEPFKGLLLGLFFISVGMELNLSIFLTQWRHILLGVVLLLFVKGTVLYLLAWLKKLRRSERLLFATVLSQGGEFAFLLFSAALTQHLLKDNQLNLLLVVVTLSMATTPLLIRLLENLLRYYYNRQSNRAQRPQQQVEDDEPQVIIVGFGRFGQVIGRLLMANQKRVTVLEKNISTVSLMRRYGYNVYYGDATDLQLLRAAGIEKAKTIVIACNGHEDTMLIIQLCQQYFPHLQIMVRVHGRVEAHEVLELGIDTLARETFLSALELGKKALVSLGMHPYQAYRAQQVFRHLDGQMLRELVPPSKAKNDSDHVSHVRKARSELEEIFQREMQQESQHFTQWEQNSE